MKAEELRAAMVMAQSRAHIKVVQEGKLTPPPPPLSPYTHIHALHRAHRLGMLLSSWTTTMTTTIARGVVVAPVFLFVNRRCLP